MQRLNPLAVSALLCTLILVTLAPSGNGQDIIFDDEPPPQRQQPPANVATPQLSPDLAERRPQFGSGGFGSGGGGFQQFNPFQIAQNVLRPITSGIQQIVNGFNPNGNHRNPPHPAPTTPQQALPEEPVPDCRTFRNTDGFCMPLQACDSLRRVLANRPQISVNRILRRSICGFSGFNSLVCCPEPDGNILPSPTQRPVPTTPPPIVLVPVKQPTRPPQATTTTTKDPFEGIGPVTLLPPPSPPRPTQAPVKGPEDSIDIRTGCGFSNASHSRIVGGREAQKGAWPWIAALGYKDENGVINYLCGGALIDSTHVVTAGHCIHNRNDLKVVRLGAHNLYAEDEVPSPLMVDVESVIPNPKYNPSTFQNDIAVIKLRQAVPFTLQVHPICLPSSQELRSSRFESKTPFVAGWGAIQFNGPSSSILREVQVPVVSDESCQEKYRPFKNTKVDDTNICAGYGAGKQDACQGDSGGPLMQPVSSNKYVLIGVVSFGFRCAEPGYPGVYSRTTAHMDWLEDTLRTT